MVSEKREAGAMEAPLSASDKGLPCVETHKTVLIILTVFLCKLEPIINHRSDNDIRPAEAFVGSLEARAGLPGEQQLRESQC